MSGTSQSEIEAAVERLERWWQCRAEFRENSHEYSLDRTIQVEDERKLIDWAVARLAADRAEREGRVRPIDAEWCRSNGAGGVSDDTIWRWVVGSLYVDWDDHNGVTINDLRRDWTFLDSIKTRGQLLDLLRALKGGAE